MSLSFESLEFGISMIQPLSLIQDGKKAYFSVNKKNIPKCWTWKYLTCFAMYIACLVPRPQSLGVTHP